MKQIIKDLISEIKTAIVNDMKGGRNKEVVMLVLNAYNRYQEDERDSVDYIFDLNNKVDLVYCIHGGMTAEDIHDLYNLSLSKTTWFYYGVNHEKPEVVNDIFSLASINFDIACENRKVQSP